MSVTSTNPNPRPPVGAPLSHAATGASSERFTRTSPPPMRVISASAPVSGFETMLVSALFMSSALSSTGVRPRPNALPGGCPLPVVLTPPNPSSRSAAEPVTIGVAPEVPPNGPVPVPDPAMAETEAPGAPISGLIRSVFSCCGPRRRADHRAHERDSDGRIELDHGVRKTGLETIRVRLTDHVAGDGRRTAAERTLERLTRGDEPDDPDQAATGRDV